MAELGISHVWSAQLLGLLYSEMSGEQKDKLESVLELIHLKDNAALTAGNLSHGQKQWLEIGMLLMQNPTLLLVDEPVAE